MGDRALVIFHSRRQDFSPVIYLHWNGREVLEWLKEATPLFTTGDTDYSASRFVGFCHTKISGTNSLGIYNSPRPPFPVPAKDAPEREKKVKEYLDWIWSRITSRDYSQGDAGVILVNVDDWTVESFHGYGLCIGGDEGNAVTTYQLDASKAN